MERRPPHTGASRSRLAERILAIPAAGSMSTEAADRWLMFCYEILSMQRDIAQRKIQGPGSGNAR
ncbi:hypothetical protein [Duganella sp. BJB475]|uniref:hypothetical protein n=1 Tax=Duganella sp. BJB475 TaxID=2233914 RepID=UPI000E34C601|nr:hypothetical protein [Duganella sp. BJB475]RFP19179.1 hypothetical protein D0T23_05200 [Duganella sp. BJB475]